MARPGKLEEKILNLLWKSEEVTTREVLKRLGDTHAYTTIMTVLDRLFKKGVVVRRKDGIAWRYKAAAPREKVLGGKAAGLLVASEGKIEPLLMAFLDKTEEIDPSVLDKLERMLRERRRGRKV